MAYGYNGCTMSMTNVLMIVGIAGLAVIAVVVLFLISAWAYAQSPGVQIAEELEDNGSIEG